MPMKTYDTQEAIPEALRASALKLEGGKFVVDEPEDPALGDAGKKALDAMKEERKKEKLRAEAAEAKLAELQRDKEARDKGITTEELQKIRDAEAAARKPIEEENAKLKAKLRQTQLTDRLEARLLKSGVMADRVKKALKDLDGRVDLTEDGDDFVVKDANGNVTTETLDDFLSKTYKAESPFFYAGPGGSGSGAEGGDAIDATGYDPAKAGRAAAAEQKRSAQDNQLAFK